MKTNRTSGTTTTARHIAVFTLVIAVLALIPSVMDAATINWIGGTGNDWSTAANWSGDNTPPAPGDDAFIDGNHTVNYNSVLYAPGTELNYLRLGFTGPETLNITANLAIANTTGSNNSWELYMWSGATVNHSAGTVILGNSDGSRSLYIGILPAATYNLTGAGALELKDWVYMNGGTFNLDGGSIASSPTFWQLHGGSTFNYTAGSLQLGGTMSVMGANSAFVFDGGGAGLQATLGPANGGAFSVTQGTLTVVGGAAVNEIIQGGSINNSLSLGVGSTYEIVINSDSDQFLRLTSSSGYGHDILLNGGTLNVLDFSDAPVGTTWDILAVNTDYGAIIGDFGTFNLPDKFAVLDNGSLSGVYTIGVIPEPASLALLAFSGLALLRRRRQHAR